MEIDLQTFLSKVVIAFPFGIAAVVFSVIGIRRISRFLFLDYQGNSKERFRDNLFGSIFAALGVACLIPAFFALSEEDFNWTILPVSLCLGASILPVGILGAYWQSYISNKLWGGLMPVVREQYGYPRAEPTASNEIDPSIFNMPRRRIIAALLVAFFIFVSSYLFLYMIGWNGSVLSGAVFRLFVSGLLALGTFMAAASASLSRRI